MSSNSTSSGSASSKAVAALGDELKAKGLATFKDAFPAKITQLQALLDNELLQRSNDDILPSVADVTPPLPTAVGDAGKKADGAAAAGAAAAAGVGRKKRKMEGSAPLHSDSEEESEDEAHPHRGHHIDYAHDFPVPSNKHIMDVIEMLRKEWKEAVELVGSVKLWIQLSIPPIESGGQFHVGVQEEVIQELNRFEDVAYNYLESPSKYYSTRAKLAAKLSRHRTVMDYRQSLLEADSLEYLNLKMAATELRNSYLMAYDMLSKNFSKLTANDSNFASRMTI